MARAPKPVVPECPRCGYDVSGTMSTWTNECPLEGKCSECGYEFQWKHLLGPNLGVPKWFFETARRKKIRAAISTSVRTVLPWKFWRDVPLHAPVSVPRLISLAFIGFIMVYFAGVLAVCARPVCELIAHASSVTRLVPWASNNIGFQQFAQRDLAVAACWPLDGVTYWLGKPCGRVIVWLFISTALMPMCFLMLQDSLRMCRVRRAQVVRVSIYASIATSVAIVIWFAGAVVWWLVYPPGFDPDRIFMDRGIGALWVWWSVGLVGWWWFACSKYLRLRHAFGVAFLLQFIASAVAFLVVLPFISPSMWPWLFQL